MQLNTLKALVGQRVRKLRTAKGLTQESVVHQSGLAESYVSEIEAGKVNATLETLNKIAEVLGLEPNAFFDWD